MPSERPAAPASDLLYARRWEILGLLWVAHFFNQADRQIFSVVLPLIRSDLQLTDQQMGLVATTFTVVFGLLVPIAGIVGDRFNRGLVVAVSLIIFSSGTLLTGLSAGLVALLMFRGVATGAGEALYQPPASSLLGSSHGARRGRALALHQSANYTGIVLGSLFAGWVADVAGWRASFLLFGVLGLVWAGVLVVRTRGVDARPKPSTLDVAPKRGDLLEGVKVLLSSPLLIGQAVGFAGFLFVLVGYLTWMPTILYERFDVPISQAGFAAVALHHIVAYGGLVIAGLIGDRMAGRNPKARVLSMAIALGLCSPLMWTLAGQDSLFIVYTVLAMYGLARGIYDASLMAAIFDVVEDRLRATVASLIISVGYIVGSLSPFVMGTLKADYGIDAGLRILAVCAAFSAILFLICIGVGRNPVVVDSETPRPQG
jgi:MFS family permease